MKSPSDKQIAFAEEIAIVLGIDFPSCSADYNSRSYFYFIKNNLDKYNEIIRNSWEPDDWDYDYAYSLNEPF